MSAANEDLLVLDSSALINFLRIDRIDLLASLPFKLIVTDVVRDEIAEEIEKQVFEGALSQGLIIERALTEISDHEAFSKFIEGGLGRGESSSIVAAHRFGATLAMDDGLAIKRARRSHPKATILTTPNLIVACIQRGFLSVEEADSIKDDWASNHRFRLKFGSFSELMAGVNHPGSHT